MTFNSEIQKRSSYRDALVSIKVRRDLTSLLVSQGSGEYLSEAPPGLVRSVSRNGVALTEVDSPSGMSNDEYVVYDVGDVQSVRVKLASAPNANTNVIICEYSLHYATDKIRANADPEDSDTAMIRWEPRLRDDPEVGTYFDDILAGVLSFADTTIDIADADNVFKKFLTINDSMRSAEVGVWAIVNGTEKIAKLYTGEVTGLVRQSGYVSLAVADIVKRLQQPAYMGDTPEESIYSFASFPNIDPKRVGSAIPFITGHSSRYGITSLGVVGFDLFGFRELDTNRSNEAACIVSSTNLLPENNVDWGMCRINDDAADNSFTSVAAYEFLLQDVFFARVEGASANYKVGDTFRWSHSGNTWCGHVVRAEPFNFTFDTINQVDINTSSNRIEVPTPTGLSDGHMVVFDLTSGAMPGGITNKKIYYVANENAVPDTFQIAETYAAAIAGTPVVNITSAPTGAYNLFYLESGVAYNIGVIGAVRQDDPTNFNDASANFNTSSTSVSTPPVGAIMKYGDRSFSNTLYLRYGVDYTVSYDATSGGNQFAKLDIIPGMLANVFYANDVPTQLDHQSHTIHYRISNGSPLKHGALLKKMCENSGLSVDSASFDLADTELDVRTFMQIPTSREENYDVYLKYAQQVCKSTLGYLTSNVDGEMIYRLIEASSGGDSLNENSSSLESYEVDYNDIVTGLIGVNYDLRSDGGSTVESATSKFLHNLNNVIQYPHVLENISTRISDILNILRHRKVIYKHIAPHVALDREIGDEATIENDEIMGTGSSSNVIITGIRKTMDETYIESTDLGSGS